MRFASPLLRAALICALLAATSARVAGAVPSAANSSHDPCFVVCPLADITYHVTVRDIANNPIANSNVVLDFSQCGFVHCPVQGPGIIVNEAARTMATFTNAAGVASFALGMGGCCPAVNITADGVLLATVSMSSPDQDASLLVNGTDASLVNAAIGTANVCADLDCTGSVNLADLANVTAHNGHSCTGVVPTRMTTWGTLKSYYR